MKTRQNDIPDFAPPSQNFDFFDWPRENANVTYAEQVTEEPLFQDQATGTPPTSKERQELKPTKTEPEIPAILPDLKNDFEEKKIVLIWGKINDQAFQLLVDTGCCSDRNKRAVF